MNRAHVPGLYNIAEHLMRRQRVFALQQRVSETRPTTYFIKRQRGDIV